MKKVIISLAIIAVVALGAYFVHSWIANKLYRDPNFTCGNGRIEATEINIAAKLAGRVDAVLVKEGDMVSADQVLVKMQTNVLEAELAVTKAQIEQSIAEKASAEAQVAVKKATLASKKADLERCQVTTRNAETQFNRYKTLLTQNATSRQHYDTAETNWLAKKSELLSAQAAVKEAEAELLSVKADVAKAAAKILASKASAQKIEADIDDSILKSPLAGRIQYRITEPGEVLSAGGRALNMVDLTDVYMTFFLPEEQAGKVVIGADVRIKLDAFPDIALPAKVTYIASSAQFTPKMVETRIERQKLMFRIKAHLNSDVLAKNIDKVKTGLPGVAWVRLNQDAPWPKELYSLIEKRMEKAAVGKKANKAEKKSAVKGSGAAK